MPSCTRSCWWRMREQGNFTKRNLFCSELSSSRSSISGTGPQTFITSQDEILSANCSLLLTLTAADDEQDTVDNRATRFMFCQRLASRKRRHADAANRERRLERTHSVTRLGEISPLWNFFEVFGQLIKALFTI